MNEDKYLCFSCNNWLINWHSLQAVNSNDAESPSGTFRSHLNSGNVVQDEKSSGSKKKVAVCRPIAQVKPRQLEVHEHIQQQLDVQQQDQHYGEATAAAAETNKTVCKINYSKRNFRLQLAKRAGTGRISHKSMQQCSCGKYMVVRSTKNSKRISVQSPLKCRKCREFSRLKGCYLRSIVQVEKELAIRESPLMLESKTENESDTQTLEAEVVVHGTRRTSENESQSINQQQQQQQRQKPQQICKQYLPKPTIDGKVVSMLRRLGTTLSREPQQNGKEQDTHNNNNNKNNLPQIMSPTKPKAKWWRPLDDDEILVNFDSSISEVLPSLADQFTTHVRKRLTFQMQETEEVIDLCDENDNEENKNQSETEELKEITGKAEVLKTTFNLPKGLSITRV